MKQLLRPALVLLLLMTALTGLCYPLLLTGAARVFFPEKAAGSLVRQGSRVAGSSLIGQSFSNPAYFFGRPSATSPQAYNAAASGASNLGPSNPALRAAVKERVAALRAADPGQAAPIPVDLVTSSASGLDPHISLAAARYQAPRVARLRDLPVEQVQALIAAHARLRWLGVFGEPRVTVLELNLALDRRAPLSAAPRR